MNELETAIYTKLAATSALTTLLSSGTAIYNGKVPQRKGTDGADWPYPCVVFSQASEIDNYALSAATYIDFIYTIKAVTKNPGAAISRSTAGSIDAAIKAALNNASLSISGHSLLSIRRVSGVPPYEEVESGVIYTHKGGQYRIFTTP